jgi:DNA (cytosine-5)-methyltransferase 1
MRYLSLFSGMEAAHLAWAPLGWECVGVAEIDPAPCAVLAQHLPNVPNLGDVVAIHRDHIAALGPIDVVIGGSPCQDLSIAGKRKGLAGARSSLFHHQVRIFDAARSLCGARWLIWENGVFAVLDSGNWADRCPILLEPESLRGDSPPRREAGQNVTGTLSARTQGGGGLGTDFDLDGGLIARTLLAKHNSSHAADVDTYVTDVSMCLNAGAMGRIDAESETLLVDAIAFDTTQLTHPENRCNPQPGNPCHPLAANGHPPALAYRWAASASETMSVGDIAPTIRSNRNGEAAVGVRRLTPRECERLQGAPDDWTLVPRGTRKPKPMKDRPRYKILGNSFAVPCIRWIGEQIERAQRESAQFRDAA